MSNAAIKTLLSTMPIAWKETSSAFAGINMGRSVDYSTVTLEVRADRHRSLSRPSCNQAPELGSYTEWAPTPVTSASSPSSASSARSAIHSHFINTIRPPAPGFRCVRSRFPNQRSFSTNNDRNLFIDQSDGVVFHLTRGVASA